MTARAGAFWKCILRFKFYRFKNMLVEALAATDLCVFGNIRIYRACA
ncbi:hypothetical protein D1AOALGA4SA_6471 [Olavius algarvensis Delta 1 endosymbiont]|nr:hypothetical protein D1AOALGA4SA_6471 [Olavius algarvensis Delta 1 endosymbiont]